MDIDELKNRMDEVNQTDSSMHRILMFSTIDSFTAINELLAERDQLKAENDKYKSADQWISVEDRLPNLPDHPCIVATNSGDVFDNHYYNQDRRKFVFNAGGFDDDTTYGVTHWMSLPNPPAKKE